MKPNVAGSFYPDTPSKLRETLHDLMSQAHILEKEVEAKAIVVPHAGYSYSGKTAAGAYQLISSQQVREVIVLAPSHYYSYQGIAVYSGEFLTTPLGDVVTSSRSRDLEQLSSQINYSNQPFQKEHSLEVQLPFLQEVVGEFQLTPLIVGQIDVNMSKEIAVALDKIIDENTLVVVSTDLAHFNQLKINNEKDQETIGLIEEGVTGNLYEANLKGDVELCGLGPVMIVMELAKIKGWKFNMIEHTNSGAVTGDTSSVVGYLSGYYS